MPAFGCVAVRCGADALIVDPDRNIWVMEYRPPAETGAARYFVFDGTGTWLGSVVMPDGLAVLWIGDEHVVGRYTDALGVESVAVHRLMKVST